MHQFFIEDLNNIQVSKSQKHQLKNVLRMRPNDTIRLVDKKGNGAVVKIMDTDCEVFEIVEHLSFKEKTSKLKCIVSLIRNERLEWMIQKAAETGVDELLLYKADHGVVKSYGSKEKRKLERFNTIALEASEQALRQFPLQITRIIDKTSLEEELLKTNLYADTKIDLPHFLDETLEEVCILTGPEGGFSDEERNYFASLNIKPVSIGDTILRAETAPMAIAIMFASKNRRGK